MKIEHVQLWLSFKPRVLGKAGKTLDGERFNSKIEMQFL